MKASKRILSVFLVVAIVLCSAPLSGFTGIELPDLFSVKAEAYTEGVFTYSVSSGKATITACNTSVSGDLVIPSTLGGYPVTNIGSWAFEDCDNFTSVTIPDSVTSIGSYAFAFCDSLTSVTIGDSVTSIGEGAFSDCYSLTSATIGDSVTSIGEGAFHYCTSLTSITVDSDNQYYSSDEYGALYNKDKTTLIQYPIGNSRETFEIPDSVLNIGDWAFFNCYSLTSVTIGDSVTSIGRYAFRYCDSLTSVTIPDSVTSIGDWAFSYCENLTDVYYNGTEEEWNEITIGTYNECLLNATIHFSTPAEYFEYTISNGEVTITGYTGTDTDVVIPAIIEGYPVTVIGDEAFYCCDSLTSVTIPDGVTSIGERVFYGCDSLTSVTIGNSVTRVGSYAFGSCVSLTSITIPDSITNIGSWVFDSCDSLTSITVNENNPIYSSDEYGVLYNKDKTTLIRYPIGNSRESFSIPDSVTSIGDYAFDSCNSLASVTIPDSVTSIGFSAFEFCNSLTSITIPDSVTSIDINAFIACDSLTSVTIGNGVTRIGADAFSGCNNLTSITVDENNAKYSSDEYGVLYNKDKTTLIQYPIGNSRTTFEIPDSVISIGYRAFYDCNSLTSITIPDSVTSIGSDALRYCNNLTDVYYNGTVEEWNKIKIAENNEPLLNANIHFNEHTPGEEVVENYIEATCSAEGSYDTVIYCVDCGEEISRVHTTISVTGPVIVTIPAVEPTCTESGLTEGSKCSSCGEIIEAQEIIPPLGHTEGETLEENRREATCTATGSYDLVKRCTVCNEVLDKETFIIEKLPHTPGSPVKENEIPSTSEKEGSYDAVTFCTECGTELSREYIITSVSDLIPRPSAHFTCTEITRVAAAVNSVEPGNVIVKSTPSGVPELSGAYASQAYAGETPVATTITFYSPTVGAQLIGISCNNADVVISPVSYSNGKYTATIESGTVAPNEDGTYNPLVFTADYRWTDGNTYQEKCVSYVETVATGGSYVEIQRYVKGNSGAGHRHIVNASASTRLLGKGVYYELPATVTTSSEDPYQQYGVYNVATGALIENVATGYNTLLYKDGKSENVAGSSSQIVKSYDAFIPGVTLAHVYVDSSVSKTLADQNIRLDANVGLLDNNNVDFPYTALSDAAVLSGIEVSSANLTNDVTAQSAIGLNFPAKADHGVTQAQKDSSFNTITGAVAEYGHLFTQLLTGTVANLVDGASFTIMTKYYAYDYTNQGLLQKFNTTATATVPTAMTFHIVDKGALREMINYVMNTDPENATARAQGKGVNPQSWYYKNGFAAFQTAYVNALDTLNNPRASQSEIDASTLALNSAYKGLTLKGADYTEASALKTEAQAIKNNASSYTEESIVRIEKALDGYKTGYSVLYQPAVDRMASNLQAAISSAEIYNNVDSVLIYNDVTGGADDFVTYEAAGSILTNKTVQLTCQINPSEAHYDSIVWSSDNGNITVDQNGLVKSTTNNSDYTLITVTVTDYLGVQHTKSIYVAFIKLVSKEVTGVSLDQSEIIGTSGGSFKLVSTVDFSAGTESGIGDVIWTSSDESVASVNPDGTVYYVGLGECYITATTVQGGYTASCKVTVDDKQFEISNLQVLRGTASLEMLYGQETIVLTKADGRTMVGFYKDLLDGSTAELVDSHGVVRDMDTYYVAYASENKNFNPSARVKITFPDGVEKTYPVVFLVQDDTSVTVSPFGCDSSSLTKHEYKASTCTKTGNVEYYECYCGKIFTDSSALNETTYNAVTIAKLPHTPAEAIEENRINATFEKEGSYDLVVYCSVCSEEISRETITIPVISHTPAAEATKENIKEPICTEKGSYDLVVYCTCCEEKVILSRQTVEIPPLGHVNGDPVKENEVEKTCLTNGSYDEVVYCTVCCDEVSRETIVMPAPGRHTAGKPAEENRVEATCSVAGSYDMVTRCRACNEVMETVTYLIPKLVHNYYAVVTEPTCTTDGYTTYTCTACGETYTDNVVPAAHTHGEWVETVAPQVGVEGEETLYCEVCNAVLETRPVDALEITAYLKAAEGSTTVIDKERGFIYGLEENIYDLEGFVEFEGGTLEYTETKAGFGTGTTVDFVVNGEVVESYTIVIFGDVTGDGVIDTFDAVVLAQVVNFDIEFAEGSALAFAADVENNDGYADTFDLAEIYKVVNHDTAISQAELAQNAIKYK